MELNSTQHKSFLWHLDIEPFTWHTFYGEQCPPFVTEDNKEAWRRYLTKVIKKHLKAEVMNTPEFRDIELQIREEKLLACMNWQELYSFASKQALLGLCFEDIERLGEEHPGNLPSIVFIPPSVPPLAGEPKGRRGKPLYSVLYLPHLSSIVFTTLSVPLVGDRNPCGRVLNPLPSPRPFQKGKGCNRTFSVLGTATL